MDTKTIFWQWPRLSGDLINSMITYLRVKKIAEIQYIEIHGNVMEHWETGEYTLYDYMSNSRLMLSQVISAAIDSGWKEDWVV